MVVANYGVANYYRDKQFLKMFFINVIFFGIIFTFLGEVFPIQITKLFIVTTPEVLEATPIICRLFFILFLPSSITILAIYYLQSTIQHRLSLVLSILKGIIINGAFIIILPIVLGINGGWIALPCCKLTVALIAIYYLKTTNF
ncbi:MAG: hypothetical protein MR210_07225 [Erysipelotrichaceae bacterium]|nr:hypothetical protein [Erysipelotrichaceae bacterium]MDY5251950.1 hypothetical protein [Erysipelotrichaceae bacterium]